MKHKRSLLIILIASALLVSCRSIDKNRVESNDVAKTQECSTSRNEALELTKDYNKQVKVFNEKLDAFKEISNESVIEMTKYGYLLSLEKLQLESEVEADVNNKISSNIISIESIKEDIAKIEEWVSTLDEGIEVARQLECPNASWIVNRLNSIDLVTETAILEDNDKIAEMVGPERDCVAIIYFSTHNVDQSLIEGNNLIEKRTEAGGSIEIYASVEEAILRYQYLSELDETILKKESYTMVGTMIIRSSNFLLDPKDVIRQAVDGLCEK